MEKKEDKIAIRVKSKLKEIIKERAERGCETPGEYLLRLAKNDLENHGMLPISENKKGESGESPATRSA